MRIGIIGQGISGLFLGIMLKMKNPDLDITIIDKNLNPGKKMLATGNGRCNLGNFNLKENSYNCKFAYNLVSNFNATSIKSFLEKIGIQTREIGNLMYPYSLSAKQTLETILNIASKYKIKFENNIEIIDYKHLGNRIELISNKKIFSFEKVIFASGSASTKNLGGTFSTYELLKKHGYKIVNPKVGLAPLMTVEETKTIESQRIKCNVNLNIDKEDIYEENGEVIFKKNGLSGIAIFNVTSMISRFKKFKKAIITLDLIPEYSTNDVEKMIEKSIFRKNSGVLEGFLPKAISEYVRKRAKIDVKENVNKEEILRLIETAKNLTFTFKDTYSFDDSQVCVGGLDLENLNENLESKIEPNIYFVGELINVDGLCGGFNIMFAIASANKVANSISL